MTKTALRRYYRDQLQALTAESLWRSHQQLVPRLTALMNRCLVDRAVKTGKPPAVCGWVPFFPGEVDLSGVIGAFSGVEWCFPSVATGSEMRFYAAGARWFASRDQRSGKLVEPSPEDGAIVAHPYEDLAIVLTPGLAFDRRGYRLGRGKAYYDRFLGQLPEGQVVKIGVGWNCQLCDELVIEPHDAQLDYFCSECEVLEFKPTD